MNHHTVRIRMHTVEAPTGITLDPECSTRRGRAAKLLWHDGEEMFCAGPQLAVILRYGADECYFHDHQFLE